jgi:coenzyme A diphosphatase NUDT7
LGLLSPFLSLYRLAVTPVVAFLTDLSLLDNLKPNPDEVHEIFDHPLEAILSPELVASIGTTPFKPLSEYGRGQWPYKSKYHVPLIYSQFESPTFLTRPPGNTGFTVAA